MCGSDPYTERAGKGGQTHGVRPGRPGKLSAVSRVACLGVVAALVAACGSGESPRAPTPPLPTPEQGQNRPPTPNAPALPTPGSRLTRVPDLLVVALLAEIAARDRTVVVEVAPVASAGGPLPVSRSNARSARSFSNGVLVSEPTTKETVDRITGADEAPPPYPYAVLALRDSPPGPSAAVEVFMDYFPAPLAGVGRSFMVRDVDGKWQVLESRPRWRS